MSFILAIKSYFALFFAILFLGYMYNYLNEINYQSTIKVGTRKANISRDKNSGVAIIDGETLYDVGFGLGYIHARDRGFQTLIQRTMAQGRVSELLGSTNESLAIDKYMRDLGFTRYIEESFSILEKEDVELLEAYCEGFNHYFQKNKPSTELWLSGLNPKQEPLQPKDITLVGKLIIFSGLAEHQGNLEKLIIELLQSDVGTKLAKTLYKPYLDGVDEEILGYVRQVKIQRNYILNQVLKVIGTISGSNNWVVNGTLSSSGKPILVTDPHLRIDMIPSIWYEVILRYKTNYVMGITVPGAPHVIMGRNKHAAYSFTYGMGDLWDYEITHCRKNEEHIECKIHETKKEDIKTEFSEKSEQFTTESQVISSVTHESLTEIHETHETHYVSQEATFESQDLSKSQDIESESQIMPQDDTSRSQDATNESIINEGYEKVLSFTEIIKRKGKDPIEHIVRELPHTKCTIEAPQEFEEGYYLCHNLIPKVEGSSRSFTSFRKAVDTFTTEGLMDILKRGDYGFNYLIADDEGNIGLQQSGLYPKRQHSGLFPFPSWSNKYKYQGFVPPEDLVSIYNPPKGWLATANNDINKNKSSPVVNANLGNYRYDRIYHLIQEKLSSSSKFEDSDMKSMLLDIQSEQADAFMKILRPILQKQVSNYPELKHFIEWDERFNAESRLATLFHNFHQAILFDVYTRVFETKYFSQLLLVNTHKWYLDRLILDYDKENEWLWKSETQEQLFTRVFFNIWNQFVEKSTQSSTKVQSSSTEDISAIAPYSQLNEWGSENAIQIEHILWRNILPKKLRLFLGLDRSFEIGGTPATLSPINHGPNRTGGVSWRMIANLAERFILTNLPGGVSDSIFSSLYLNDVDNWFRGKFKRLVPL